MIIDISFEYQYRDIRNKNQQGMQWRLKQGLFSLNGIRTLLISLLQIVFPSKMLNKFRVYIYKIQLENLSYSFRNGEYSMFVEQDC